MNDKDGNEMW